jgi:hypothetical protein
MHVVALIFDHHHAAFILTTFSPVGVTVDKFP